MIALTFDEAKSIAIVAIVVLLALAIASAWLMKKVVQKVILVAVLALLAVGVWSQRESLEDCSDTVRAAGTDITHGDVEATCSFFGRDVQITEAVAS